jgi:hypothetical protein
MASSNHKKRSLSPAESGHLCLKFPSEIPAGEIRRLRNNHNGQIFRILALGSAKTKKKDSGESYWIRVPKNTEEKTFVEKMLSAMPARKPFYSEFMQASIAGENKMPEGTFCILDYSPTAQNILPEPSEIPNSVKEWLKPKEVAAFCDALPVFQTSEYGNGWGASQATITGFIYRGDIGQHPKDVLNRTLRLKYPNCLINGR